MNANTTITIDLPCGPICALKDDDIVYARGIRYATAARFHKPTPTTWTEVRDCTKPASICPQNPSRLDMVTGDITGGRAQSEDCLHVTVAAPPKANNLPVMVYFHGGAYISGGGDLDAYNPCHLARKNVVVVTVTHRLGHFGYLPIPGIAPANLGLLDQIEALRWVQKNISAFGGDPERVTLFGQSAGGDSIFCLMVCETAKGLFHRAILQSAPMGRFGDFESSRLKATEVMAEHTARFLASSNKPLSTEEYLALQPELLAVAMKTSKSPMAFAPICGEEPIPPPSQLKQLLQDAAKRIPVFIGLTLDEGSAFAALVPNTSAEWFRDVLFKDGCDGLHHDICEVVGKSPSYDFNWHPEGNIWGAAHCIELPFLLGGARGWSTAGMLEGCDKEAVIARLGDSVKNLWVAFAYGDDFEGRHFVIDDDFTFARG